jgi:hypothetical protein
MDKLLIPFSTPGKPQILRLVPWLLLVETTLLTLIMTGAGIALTWFTIHNQSNHDPSQQIGSELIEPRSPMPVITESEETPCIAQGSTEVAEHGRTCLTIP